MNDFGKLVLRLSVGVMMLLHGISKAQNVDGTMQFVQGAISGLGMPAFLAYGVFLGELVAPALLILGVLPRLSSLAIMATMAVAALTHTIGEGANPLFSLSGYGGWSYELQGLYFFAALAIVIMGSGKISLYGKFLGFTDKP